MTEGIPDYIRWFLYEPQSKGAEITARNFSRARYDGNYRITANFLNWVIRKYEKEFHVKLNAAARQGKCREEFWKEHAGRALRELGDEWREAHRVRLGLPVEGDSATPATNGVLWTAARIAAWEGTPIPLIRGPRQLRPGSKAAMLAAVQSTRLWGCASGDATALCHRCTNPLAVVPKRRWNRRERRSIPRLLLALGLLTYRRMQREQKSPKGAAKLSLAGLLAVLLLAFGTFAANGSLHHAVHHDSAGDANACVICSLAQGHVDLPVSSPILVATVVFPLCGWLAASAGVPWSFDFLLPPGRAPPGIAHSL